ncbi:hypothetical protein QTI66_22085 [Variovorax sp. J22R133]|uniref:hypothetical protein n=1 Tax=Variovorax brevis TaxID=3053503 RepID=UPI0025778125|nr:hypothetical protein [Variovorax sp. J22R133]MDM0114855.1 hypothetical protein [Variovorax sp. J22R133]
MPKPDPMLATPPADPAPAIADALEKNKQVAEEIKDAADDLLVVHTVLESELPEGTRQAEIDQAVEQTGEIEKRLAKSAEVLDQVNEALERASEAGKAS